jgi:hypothetical protein
VRWWGGLEVTGFPVIDSISGHHFMIRPTSNEKMNANILMTSRGRVLSQKTWE